MLHDTWVQSTVSPCYQHPLTYHLFDMQLSCGMGHRMIVLVRLIKYARHMLLHHILHCLQWSSTWLVFLRYWHSRLMWYALSWLDYMTFLDIPCYFILWSCDYVTRQLLVQDVSCSLYTCHTMHAWSYCTWSIFLIIHVIVITFSHRYRQTYYSYVLLIVFTFSYSLFNHSFPFVYSC